MADRPTTPEPNLPSKKLPATSAPSPPWLLFFLPLVWLGVLVVASPNFRWTDAASHDSGQPRAIPYGGDYLQEWIGGKVILSQQSERLYDLKYVTAQQHDESVVGFQWPLENYFPMVYPPFHYWLVTPLAYLSYRWAFLVWSLLSVMAFSLTGALLWRQRPKLRAGYALGFGAAMLFVPWLNSLIMGQKSSLLLLLFAATYGLLQRGNSLAAGLLFGFVAIKPPLAVALVLMMAWKRKWAFLSGVFITIGGLATVTWCIEPRWWSGYVAVMSRMGSYLESGGYQLADAHSLWAAVKLAMPALDTETRNGITVTLAIGVLVLLGWGWRGKISTSSPRFDGQFSLAMFATVLISPHFYTYDLTLLLLPMSLIVAQMDWQPWSHRARWIVGLLVAFWALVGLFPIVADATRIQPSVLILLTLMWLVAEDCREPLETQQVVSHA